MPPTLQRPLWALQLPTCFLELSPRGLLRIALGSHGWVSVLGGPRAWRFLVRHLADVTQDSVSGCSVQLGLPCAGEHV